MRKKELMNAITICILLLGLLGCSDKQQELLIEDVHGVLSETKAPVSVEVKLNKDQLAAAKEGRLGIYDQTDGSKTKNLIPTQLDGLREGTISHLVLMMPEGEPGPHSFKLVENTTPFNEVMKATLDPNSGQVMIEEGGEKVMQYNYETVYENDVVYGERETLEHHVRTERDTFVTTSIYAVPRSDYIHPLYGLEGEMLTRDWPVGGHPHHRAIFWAWPEVEYGSERGDIYALQRVFARPTGNMVSTGGAVFAQIEAENLWMWDDSIPIVHENALIKVYRATETTRIIDLSIQLVALENNITIATRGTDSYGGLNLRMQTPTDQEISYFTDNAGSNPIRSWSDFEGIFEGNESASGLMVLQHKDNPEYPGDWVEYPNLAWVQPTFPSPGTRYPLSKDESLVLRYRLIIHEGGKPSRDISEKRWDAYHAASTPQYYNDQPALNN
jgi:hypothetical protein